MNAPLAVFAAFFIALLAANAFPWQDTEAAETKSKSSLAVKAVAQTQAPKIVPPRAPQISQSELPDWRRYAAPSTESGEVPIIALVIDDLGHNEGEFVRVMALGKGITLAILPYTKRAAEFAQRARQQGFEILVHMPMEPEDSSADPGPNALMTNLSDSELMRRLSDNLARLAGYVGINNHMGSKFSQNRHAMSLVLGELEARGLLYLDSVTINSTIGARLAEESRMPYASRDVFLDNLAEQSFIEDQLRVLEKIARETGRAVAIGHPYDETLAVLKRWLPDARRRGFEFVPISTIAAMECAC